MKEVVDIIINLVKENQQLRSGIWDIRLSIAEKKKGNIHASVENSYVDDILKEIREMKLS